MIPNLRTVTVTRYITPLREGGSLPALAEACDDFKYVIKFRGAGHGVKALISELLGGVIAQYLGLPVPELVFIELDEAFGQTEGDEEIQDLLKFSKGLNLGLHYLSGAVTYDVATNDCDELLASKIVWLDSFITNVDRTFRNTNLLIWHKELWLIDHGASFYFHHSWDNWEKTSVTPFTLIKDHALIKKATKLQEAHNEFTAKLNNNVLRELVNIIPDEFLNWEEGPSNEEIREVYYQFLSNRLAHADIFLKAAQDAR
ncbi:hypothetical protein SAMN05421741_11174 [Paenimyroides ummariense]|uniref:HipA-like kinase domain-containing protein n=1 Tax=Paenimyroides ummariense TaxID=913024 RepID=A0A1I5C322_9FLAO|nr:HipA family kinase [Paenimyroides ummariense]SFN81399.1 hypothetical protein SAMN05421741_11174 [Paenimyroides ummariense]